MLCIKTSVRPSKISGLGLFTEEDITKGTIVWEFNHVLDKVFSKKDLSKLSFNSRKQILNYSYLDNSLGGYVLCGDDARFFNHSENCNCDDSMSNITIANRNILAGEELTVNYKVFYDNFDEKELI